jgi:hypothetical protein
MVLPERDSKEGLCAHGYSLGGRFSCACRVSGSHAFRLVEHGIVQVDAFRRTACQSSIQKVRVAWLHGCRGDGQPG